MASLSLNLQQITAQWQRLGRRQRLAVTTAGVVLVGWGVYLVIFHPLQARIHALQQVVREAEQRLQEAIAATAQADAVNKAFSAYEPYLKRVGSPEAQRADVLSDVESAVRQSGMTLLDLRPSSARSEHPDLITISVEGEASPAQLAQLLDLLQRSTRLLKVTELNIRVSEGKTLRTSMIISKLLLK